MTELYMKVAGRWHKARKTVPDDIFWDRCRKCSLRRSCRGKSFRNSLAASRACDVFGHGFTLSGPPRERGADNFWETCRTYHPRVIVEGSDPKHGKFRIPCDAGMAPLVIALNMAGVRTRYSCQGDPGDDLSAYINIDRRDESRTAVRMILDFWKGHAVYRSGFNDDSVSFYMADRPKRARRRDKGEEATALHGMETMELLDPKDYKEA